MDKHLGLFGRRPLAHFNGPEYKPQFDLERLTGQMRRIYDLMSDGEWRSLEKISRTTGDPQASVSAQLRHLRKDRFGGHAIEKVRVGDPHRGFYRYRLVIA